MRSTKLEMSMILILASTVVLVLQVAPMPPEDADVEAASSRQTKNTSTKVCPTVASKMKKPLYKSLSAYFLVGAAVALVLTFVMAVVAVIMTSRLCKNRRNWKKELDELDDELDKASTEARHRQDLHDQEPASAMTSAITGISQLPVSAIEGESTYQYGDDTATGDVTKDADDGSTKEDKKEPLFEPNSKGSSSRPSSSSEDKSR